MPVIVQWRPGHPETAPAVPPLRNPPRARIRRGLGGHGFALAAGLAVQFASVPLFLSFWGATLYGEWLMLVALQGWLLLLDFGYTATTVNEAAMCAARGDLAGARAWFQSAWALVTALSLAAAAALAALLAAAPLAVWLGLAELGRDGATVALSLLAAQALLHLQTGLLGAGLAAAGQYGLLALLLALTRCLGFALTALAVALGGGPQWAALALASAELAGCALVAACARRHSPWLRHGLAAASLERVRRLAAPSFGLAGLAAGNALVIQGPVVVLGATLEPAAAAVFSTLRMLARAPVFAASAVFATLRAEATLARGSGDMSRVRLLNTQATRFALWLGVAAFLALQAFGPWMVALWTGGEIAASQPLFALLLAGAAATLLWTGMGTALLASNRGQRVARVYLPVAGAALLAAGAVAPALGAAGVAAVLAAAEWLVAALLAPSALAFLGQRAGPALLAALRPPTGLLGRARRER